jgi:hypothetical protein
MVPIDPAMLSLNGLRACLKIQNLPFFEAESQPNTV